MSAARVIEDVRCGRCGLQALVGSDGLALIPGWSAIFVHQEIPGLSEPMPLGYACPSCTAEIVPLYVGRAREATLDIQPYRYVARVRLDD